MLKGVILAINVIYFLLFFCLGFTQLFPWRRKRVSDAIVLWCLGVPALITAIYLLVV